MEFTPIILVHMLAAIGAIITGGLALSLKKGTPLHRVLGRSWVLLMLIAVLVSFGIKSDGHFSWIHLLSVGVLFALGASVSAAIRGRIGAHRRGMTYTYIGLLVAGAFTFLPYRRLGHLVWSAAGLI
jgi:uncharacterized membrane protein